MKSAMQHENSYSQMDPYLISSSCLALTGWMIISGVEMYGVVMLTFGGVTVLLSIKF